MNEQIPKMSVIVKNFLYCTAIEENHIVFYLLNNKIDIRGNSCVHVLKILENLNEELTVNELLNQLAIDEEYISSILKYLEEKKIIKFNSQIIVGNDRTPKELNVIHNNISNEKNNTKPSDTLLAIITKKILIISDALMNDHSIIELKKYFDVKISKDTNQVQIIEYDPDIIITLDGIDQVNREIEIQEIALKLKIPFIRIVLSSNEIRIGPMFNNENPGCYECFVTRSSTNGYLDKSLSQMEFKGSFQHQIISDVHILTFSIIRIQLLNYFLNNESILLEGEIVFNYKSLNTEFNPSVLLPCCKNCS